MSSITPRRLHVCVLLSMLLAAASVVASPAAATVTSHAGTCEQPDGRGFRVSYTYNSDNAIVQVTDMQTRTSSGAAWSNFGDYWGLVSKLEWWSPETFNSLFMTPPAGTYASPAVTLALDMDGYNRWWASVDQRSAILAQPVYAFLNPRVSFRNTGDPLNREADSCDVYIGGYSAGSGGAAKRVAHVGDSISDQMAPELNRRNNGAGRKYWIDPQSGQSYRTMIGELRGINAGLRSGGDHVKPDVLVMALGTNDVGGSLWATDFEAWKTGLGWIVARAMIDTSAINCRVVMTVRDMGRDPGYENTRLAQAADAFNTLIGDIVNANPAKYRLVDWNVLAAAHRPGSSVPWFTLPDRTHPNADGLNALRDAILSATTDCGG